MEKLALADRRPDAWKEMVSLVELKKTALKMLPEHSVLRSLILAEPDYLPIHEALSRITVFSRLLDQEFGFGNK
jgi:hypothetical protein